MRDDLCGVREMLGVEAAQWRVLTDVNTRAHRALSVKEERELD